MNHRIPMSGQWKQLRDPLLRDTLRRRYRMFRRGVRYGDWEVLKPLDVEAARLLTARMAEGIDFAYYVGREDGIDDALKGHYGQVKP